MRRLWNYCYLFMFTLLLLPESVAAQLSIRPATNSVTQKVDGGALAFLSRLYGRVFLILGIIATFLAVGLLIYQGIKYITSTGDPAKVKAARNGIISIITGVIVIAIAYFVIRIAIALGGYLANL